MNARNVLNTTEHTTLTATALSAWKDGAGDGDRTRDIQLGKLQETTRSTENQALTAGTSGQKAALLAPIEHNSEHKTYDAVVSPPTETTLLAEDSGEVPQNPQPTRNREQAVSRDKADKGNTPISMLRGQK